MADSTQTEPGTPASRTRRLLLGGSSLDLKPYLYLLPIILLYAIFVVYPVGYSFWMSFTDFVTVDQVEWVGLSNYAQIFSEPEFWQSVVNSLVFSLGTVVSIAIGLLLALVLDSDRIRGKTVFQSIIFLPYVLPIVVASVLFGWMFTQFGVVNSALMEIGLISQPIGWLSSPTLALPTVITVTVWKNLGFNMLIFMAGIQSIPDEIYEAAKVAGKSRWATFRHVTLPLLKTPLVITTVLGMINAIRGFDAIWVMTEGGPGNASQTLGVYFYRSAFASGDFSTGAAIGVIMFVISIVLSGGVLLYARRS
ncbi:carbohydrate ABC transporter permease [Halococcus sp. IIIV-5B]|uniref:carbohydrate ABC transporter permease n=1 Tax=Halococcus sp. IIIV-5B TaxID=2321230 RepID=UPI001F32EE92|nr:sugar ABC transporter permease [Halococcus sp. IIIV-5B]